MSSHRTPFVSRSVFTENRPQGVNDYVGLYNHGGWQGEPESMVAMVEWLREHARADHAGIVYNFHHGHEHLARFPEAFRRMVPYLICVNLNGMQPGGPKIVPLGRRFGWARGISSIFFSNSRWYQKGRNE